MAHQPNPLFEEDFDYIEAPQEAIIPDEIVKEAKPLPRPLLMADFYSKPSYKRSPLVIGDPSEIYEPDEKRERGDFIDPNNPRRVFKKRYWVTGLVLAFALIIGVFGLTNTENVQDVQANDKNQVKLEQKRIEEIKAQQKAEGDTKLAEREAKKAAEEEAERKAAEEAQLKAEEEAKALEEERLAEEARIAEEAKQAAEASTQDTTQPKFQGHAPAPTFYPNSNQ